MYQLHFNLSDRPFASVANPDHYFPASSVEQAREVIAVNVERASGTTMLVGAVGTGKSLLCQLIANQFSSELPVCTIESGQIRTSEELLQAVLHGLDLPHHGELSELRITLSNHITGQSCLNGVLLIVDEAERLSVELLEEIRVLTNLVKDGQPCVRLLLAGAESLEEKLASPALESLNQRVVGRLYLENFSQEETRDYICARINAVAGDATTIFSDDSFGTVYQATNGVPRLINQLCDHTLLLASVAGQSQVDGGKVEEAWADLYQLPMTNNRATQESPRAESEVVVEFGSLEEDDAQAAGAAGIVSQVNDIQTVVDVTSESPASVEIHFGDDVEAVPVQEASIEINEDANAQIVFDDLEEQESDSEQASDQVSDAGQVVFSFDDEQSENDDETEDDVDRHSPFADESVATTDEQSDGEDEGSPYEETVGESPMEELTMEQATNPFGEQFGTDAKINYGLQSESTNEAELQADEEPALQDEVDAEVQAVETDEEQADQEHEDADLEHADLEHAEQEQADLDEEVVIQDFASPSQFAREDREDVSSNYSENLAEQLSVAQPALRMHDTSDEQDSTEPDAVGQDAVGHDAVEQDEASEFAPLSSYTRDEETDEENPAIVIAMQDDEQAADQQYDGEFEDDQVEAESASLNEADELPAQFDELDSGEVAEDTRDAAQIDETLDGIEQELEQAEQDHAEVTAEEVAAEEVAAEEVAAEEVTAEDETSERDGAEDFDPKSDPVMPEEGVESMISEMSSSMDESLRSSAAMGAVGAAGIVAQAATSFPSQVAVAEPSEAVEEEVAVEAQVEPSEQIEAQAESAEQQREKPKKLFRTLFSSMRSN